MQFLCIIIANCLANQPYPFITFPILLIWQLIILICCTNVLPIITNLTQCFTWPVYHWLPIICQFIITNYSIGNPPHWHLMFYQSSIYQWHWEFTNTYKWFTIGSYWQWYEGNTGTYRVKDLSPCKIKAAVGNFYLKSY